MKTQATDRPDTGMSAMDAIYKRRAVRSYTSEKISKDIIQKLLDAAVYAPTAVHEEPWAFAIIQDKETLNRLSETAKRLIAKAEQEPHSGGGHSFAHILTPDFNIFYNSGTLIVIYGKPMGKFVVADCWLAGENLMLAACAMGLGTCVIGLSVEALNTPEWKKEFNIPENLTAFAPIIVGIPSGDTPMIPRNEPEILFWKE